MTFEVLLSKKKSAIENMQADIQLLESLESNPRKIVHLYSWVAPSATYGYFLDPDRYFNADSIKNKTIQIARRPTGGGIIFHHCDLAFSVLIPSCHPSYSINTLENYAVVNNAVAEAIQSYLKGEKLDLLQQELKPCSAHLCHFCMAHPTKYDVLLEGRKVAGGAQRRTKYGLLHQGTISLYLPQKNYLKNVLLTSQDVAETMEKYSWPLLRNEFDANTFTSTTCELQHLLIESIRKI